MSLTLKEAIQAQKLKLIASELEALARKDRAVKKIVDTLKKGREPKPEEITALKGDTQDEVVMAFASVIGPMKTTKFLGEELKTIKVGEDAVGAEKPHYVIVKDRKVIAKGDKKEMMEKCGEGERVWLSTKNVGDVVEGKEDPDIGDRKGSQPAGYHKGLAPSTKEKRDAQFKKQAEMSDDDPAAYKPAPGDKEAKTKPSQYTKKYDKMFGEETLEEQNTEKALRNKSEETGVAYSILKDVYDRGVAAWRTGHRPGTTPAQWGMARVNSFVTGGKTQKTADADLWKKHKGQNEEVDMSDNELLEAAIKASVVEKEIADMVGKQNVKMKLSHIEFKHKGKTHKIPVDRGYVKGADYDDFLEMQESVELDEAVSVKSKKYSWGTMITVHDGRDESYPLHPEHQKAIKGLKDGGKTSFKDETGRIITAHRKGDTVELSGPRTNKKTSVDLKHFTESVELDEAVRVDDSRFKRAHKEAPKGKGLWGFTTKSMGRPKDSEMYMPALSMDYKQAVEMGKKWAERQGSSVVYVLESVSKNTAFGYANRGRSTFKSMHKMVKQLVRADDDMVTNYLDSSHGRHLADAERDLSAMKLKDYIKKDFAMFKKNYDPKLFERADAVKRHDIRKMNQAERIKQGKIMKGYKFANPKPVKEANAEDMMPASPDEKSMALKQAEFIQYVGREIGEHLVANKEFPEWMQNKLSALHQKAKDMHATLGAHGGEMDESVELDENRIADAAVFLKRVWGFESRYERFERQRKEAAQKLKKSDIEGFVKDAEPFLNFIKGGKANYYKSLLNKLKASAKDFDSSDDNVSMAKKAIDHMVEIRNYISKNKSQVRKEEVEMSNYNYRTEAHSPMHVSKAVRVAERMGGNMTGAVEKIERMAKGLSDHPKVKAALRMANESVELTEKAKVSGYYQKNKEPRHKGKTDKNSSTEQLIHKYLEAADILDNEDFGSTPYDFASRDLDYLGSLLNKRGFSVGELNKMADKFSRDEKYPMIKEDFSLTEKAESEAQAIAARIALKHKREGTKPEPGTASAEMMKMSEKDLEDFTKVKKGAPEKVEEATDLMESHYKVGQKVKCIESGMTGTVVHVDPSDEGKYYTVKREDGKKMKYAPNELKPVGEVKESVMGLKVLGWSKRKNKVSTSREIEKMNMKTPLDTVLHAYIEVADALEKSERGGAEYDSFSADFEHLESLLKKKRVTTRDLNKMVDQHQRTGKYPVIEEAMDPVDKDALKKKFAKRKDKDIDNDGDVDSSDEYLHKRRSTISKAIAKEQSEVKLKEKDVDGDGDADDLDKSLEKRKQKVLDTSE